MSRQTQTPRSGHDYQRIARAISFIQGNIDAQPSLAEVAAHISLSPYHFQRLFRRWAGVSPKRFLEYLTVNQAKRLLDNSNSILDASLELGLSSPARLHDQFVSIEAMTPGQYKDRGRGLSIDYGFHPSPFGEILLAKTTRGICKLAFVDAANRQQEVEKLGQLWQKAKIKQNDSETAMIAAALFADFAAENKKLRLLVHGTNFQVSVWRALLKIPSAKILAYKDIAKAIGKPSSVRAVANAIGANPVAYLIPCHRVLRSTGELGGYRWGTERKGIMLAWELARSA